VLNIFQTGLRWLWVAVIIFIMDRLTKHLVQKYLIAYIAQPVTSFFNLTLIYNTGASFGFLNNASGWQGWVFGVIALIVSMVILFWLACHPYQQVLKNIALCLIIGGALGNFWDRITYGHVIDFLQFHLGQWYFATFNLADSAICVGAFLLICEAIIQSKKKGNYLP
jgi:signal peptidase II